MKLFLLFDKSISDSSDIPNPYQCYDSDYDRCHWTLFYTIRNKRDELNGSFEALDIVSDLYFYFKGGSGQPLGYVKCYGDDMLSSFMAALLTCESGRSGAVFFDDVRDCFVAHLYF